MKNIITKRQYKDKKNLGGMIGTGIGAIGGTFLGNPMLGAKLGGMTGSMIGNSVEKDKPNAIDINYSPASLGYALGGFMPEYKLAFGGPADPPDQYDLRNKTKRFMKMYSKYDTDKLEKALENAGTSPGLGSNSLATDAIERILIKRKSNNRNTKGSNWGSKGADRTSNKAGGGKVPKSIYKYGGNPYAEMYLEGGEINPIGQDAAKVEGPSHENGGVDVGNNTEVEGGETIDKVGGSDYVFSKRLKVPGTYKTFAEVHEEMVKNNSHPQNIEQLAKIQERVAGRDTGAQTSEKKYAKTSKKRYAN